MAASSNNDIERTICRSIELDDLHVFTSLVVEDYDRLITPSPLSHKQALVTLAITFDARQIYDFLIQHGADLNKKGTDNWTPLLEAIRVRSLPLIKSLLSHGADVALAGGKATTWPLLEALRTDDPEIVRILAQYADTEHKEWAIRSQIHDSLSNRASIRSILEGDST